MNRLLTILALFLMLLQTTLAHAAEPKIILPTMKIWTQRFTRYTPPGRKEPIYTQWSWTPRLEFTITGPLEGGSQLVVNFSRPDGSPWLSANLPTPEIGEDRWQSIVMPDFPEGKAATFTGSCPIQIVLKNSLANTKKVLFTGKYEVKKYKMPLEKSAGATEFYVDQDWTLPLAYLGMNLKEEAPPLEFRIWMRGGTEDIDKHLAGYIFLNGKQISSSRHKNDAGSPDEMTLYYDTIIVTPGMNQGDPAWYRLLVTTSKIRAYLDTTRASSANNYSFYHFLATNPGEYELKLTWDGKPIRSLKFTVDKSGQVVNNGMNAKLNTLWYAYPVTTEPGGMPGANLSAYKTGAFYGNPL